MYTRGYTYKNLNLSPYGRGKIDIDEWFECHGLNDGEVERRRRRRRKKIENITPRKKIKKEGKGRGYVEEDEHGSCKKWTCVRSSSASS